jgi:WD40 repeat protein
VLHQTTQLRRRVLGMAQGQGAVYVVCPPIGPEGQGAMFCVCELDMDRAVPELAELFFAPKCTGLACSPRDDFVCVWSGHDVVLYDRQRKATAPNIRHNREVRCSLYCFPHFSTLMALDQLSAVAFHPRDPLVALGDVVGHIVFWRCGTEGQKGALVDRMHWHAHGVHTLAFSGADGSVLISGGQEDAVVFWQLLTRKKLFVPHLGSLGVYR